MASSETRTTTAQSNLHQQDLSKLDVTKLSALSPEVISRQATINIGTIGHVAHGKSTVVKAISGVQTVRFKNELERNITIKLERLSDTFIKVYSDRADEKQEQLFYEKIIKPRKRNLSPEPDSELEDSPPSKKKKPGPKTKEYIIEKILDMKFASGEKYFYVKWKGYSEKDNTWEPIENLANCPLILKAFIADLELEYCEDIEKLKTELAFDNLLSEEKLIKRFSELEKYDIEKLKLNLLITLISMITLSPEEEDNISDLVESARDILQLYTCAKRRCRQLMALKNWEEHVNQVDKCKRLMVENQADLSGPPDNFTYINQCIPGVGITIPDEPPIGCECSACNCRSKSCCGNQGGIFAYTVNKRLRVASGTPVYECNKACKCSTECNNRVVQNGRKLKLCIFRTFNGCGWAVRTEQKIYQGQFVCKYVGEVITFEEAEKRGREYDANGLTYLFDLDFNSVENPYTVDAAHLGNISHFINHSCEPNLGVWAVWADCLDPNLPMLALFATRDIEAGEELCFDYLQKGSDVEVDNISLASHSTSSEVRNAEGIEATVPSEVEMSPSKTRFGIQQDNLIAHKNRTECKCGAVNCRKYLF